MPRRAASRLDWPGNITFALGLVGIMVGITYGIQPYGDQTMGWTSPLVVGCLAGGVAMLVAFVLIELRAPQPMFRLSLFRIRAFTAGSLATLLASIGRGGLMFMLIIWLQGIWLPRTRLQLQRHPAVGGHLHAPAHRRVPLRRADLRLPLGPLRRASVRLGGMVVAAGSFLLLELLPIDVAYPAFGLVLLLNGLAMGAFAAPNRAGVMNSLPPEHRGVGSGMNTTFQNAAQVLSIGIFFTLMIVGLSSTLPTTLSQGLLAHGVPAAAAQAASHLPPVSILFAAFLGYNPIQHLLGASTLAHVPASQVAVLTGRGFFPSLIAGPFASGLHAAFDFAIVACLAAAAASWLRGGRYVHGQDTGEETSPVAA